MIQQETKYVFETIEKTEAIWNPWMDTLRNHYSKHIPACKWLLAYLIPPQSDFLMRYLVNSQFAFVRNSFSQLLLTCIETLDPHESKLSSAAPRAETASDHAAAYQQMLAFHFQSFANRPKTIKLIYTIIKRIVDNPVPQNRIIRINCPLYQEHIERVDGAANFLFACQFKQEKRQAPGKGPVLSNYDIDEERFKVALQLLESKEEKNQVQLRQVDMASLMKSNVHQIFLNHLISLMPDVRVQWKTFHQYWSIFEKSSQFSHHIREFLNKEELGLKVIDQYMGNASPIWQKNHPGKTRPALSATTVGCTLAEMMNSMAHMVRACHNDVTVNEGVPVPPTSYPGCPLFPQNLELRNYIFCDAPPVTQSLLGAEFSPIANKLVFTHYAWEDWKMTTTILSYLQRVRSADPTKGNGVYEGLLAMTDSLAKRRVAYMFSSKGGFLSELDGTQFHHSTLLNSLSHWIKIPNVAGYVLTPTIRRQISAVLDVFSKSVVSRHGNVEGNSETINHLRKFFAGDHLNYVIDHYPEDYQYEAV